MDPRTPTRGAIADLVEAFVLGPIEEEETIPSAPADTYLTGILWPRGTTLSEEEDDAGEIAADDGSSEADGGIPGYRAIRPCSIGLTFAVDSGVDVGISLAATARYEPAESKIEAAPGDAPATFSRLSWTRRPLRYSAPIPAGMSANTWRINEFVLPDGSIQHDDDVTVHVRRRITDGQQVYTVTLINSAVEADDDLPRDTRLLFQCGLQVEALDATGTSAIRPRPRPLPVFDNEDAATSALIYRRVREYATGHGVAATWGAEEGQAVATAATSWMPRVPVSGTDPDGHETLKQFSKLCPGALAAAQLADESRRADIINDLEGFAGVYARWIDEALKPDVDCFGEALSEAAARNLRRCEEALIRMRDGIELLRTDDQAFAAFALANRAMDMQSRFPSKQRPGPLVWRPFQLAFMLLVIPSLVRPERPDRLCMDLLWFPTGGGKTEAYLGLTAFQIFYRRLTSPLRRRAPGVDVLMRYTLRLLTVQQFQRAAALIAACEAIRKQNRRLGGAAVSLGLYVGSDSTPNWMEDAREAIRKERAGEHVPSTPRQLLDCPVCGHELPASSYEASATDPEISIKCRNRGCATEGAALPILTVDELIYDEPPSLLIGTVDKFAQMPRKRELGRIFGLGEDLGPGLIIQDELHLISGPLGSMAGLYEAAIDLACSRDGVRPKIIGSTATIGQAARQVRALFDRSVLQFPPPGFDAEDSFFAVTDLKGPDRLYIGLSSAGRSPKFALQAAVAAVLEAAARERDAAVGTLANVDPYWTCVSYFNSLRELGGAWVMMQDDVPRQQRFLAGRLGRTERPVQNEPLELSSRIASRELPEVIKHLGATLMASEEDPYAAVPVDLVLASNMISVGVDIGRLGLMVVNGQPKTTSEYIQASSRVGRGLPGLVFTLYNFGRPRDLSHFEHFTNYHGALYRAVEGTSVTPWAPRARDKALHAVLAASIRHLAAGMDRDEDAIALDPEAEDVTHLLNLLLERIHSSSDGLETEESRADLEAILEQWARRTADSRSAGKRLLYWEKKAPFGKTAPHLMTSAEEGSRPGGLAWPTPNSMREVEPSTAFILKRIPERGS